MSVSREKSPRIDEHFLRLVRGSVRLSEVALRYMQIRRRGSEFVGLSPFKPEKTPSFTINDDRRFYHCFASGQHGDVIDLVRHFEGLDFIGAVRFLCDLTGLEMPGRDERDGPKMSPELKRTLEAQRAERQAEFERAEKEHEKQQAKDRVARMEAARQSWRGARPGAGTLVETYLASRNIDLAALQAIYGHPVPPSLRFHPQVWHSRGHTGPAMIAVLQDAKGDFTGVHRTWLAPDGMGKAAISTPKKCLGSMSGSSIRLSAVGGRCFLAEGIENTLFVMGALAGTGKQRGLVDGAVFGLCGVSLGNIAGAGLPWKRGRAGSWLGGDGEQKGRFISLEYDPDRPGLDLPAGVRELVLLCDADGKDFAHDRMLMDRAARKFRRTVTDVRLAWPVFGQDFNDMAVEG